MCLGHESGPLEVGWNEVEGVTDMVGRSGQVVITPKGARLLKRMFEAGLIQQRVPSSRGTCERPMPRSRWRPSSCGKRPSAGQGKVRRPAGPTQSTERWGGHQTPRRRAPNGSDATAGHTGGETRPAPCRRARAGAYDCQRTPGRTLRLLVEPWIGPALNAWLRIVWQTTKAVEEGREPQGCGGGRAGGGGAAQACLVDRRREVALAAQRGLLIRPRPASEQASRALSPCASGCAHLPPARTARRRLGGRAGAADAGRRCA